MRHTDVVHRDYPAKSRASPQTPQEPVDAAHGQAEDEQQRGEDPRIEGSDGQPQAGRQRGPPMADAATWRLTVRLVPVTPAPPARCAVVRVSSGKIGAAARPTVSMPMTARMPGPGTAMSAAPRGTPATALARTRDGPTRSATGPRTTRPANIVGTPGRQDEGQAQW